MKMVELASCNDARIISWKAEFSRNRLFLWGCGRICIIFVNNNRKKKRIWGVAEGQEEASMEMQDKENIILPRKISCMQKV